MRIGVAKVGMEIADKLTGIVYRIDEITTDEAAKNTIAKAQATEILDEDETREPKRTIVTAANDITFKVVKWVPDEEKHSANVINGILQVDGQDVVMGTIVAKNILKIFPGTVVFTAVESENDRDIVYEYTPSRDKFARLGEMETSVRVIEDTDTRTVYGFSLTKQVEVEENGQKKTETVFDRAGLYVLTKGMLDFESIASNSEDSESFDDYDEYEDYDDDADERCAEDDLENFLGFDFTKAVIAQGGKYFYIPAVDDEKDVTYAVFRITNIARRVETVTMPDFLTAVTANNTSARNLGRVIFSGEGFVKIDNVIIRSNELAGYIYLVDAQRDRANDVNTYVFAAEDRKLKKAIRKNTPDRGPIITIE